MFTVSNFDYKSHRVTYTGTDGEYETGKEYEILIQKMLCNRYAVFKSSAHYNEVPGYKVFKTYDEIKTQFNGL